MNNTFYKKNFQHIIIVDISVLNYLLKHNKMDL